MTKRPKKFAVRMTLDQLLMCRSALTIAGEDGSIYGGASTDEEIDEVNAAIESTMSILEAAIRGARTDKEIP